MKERPTFEELRLRASTGKRYADVPGTGPEGATCKTCDHLRYTGTNKRFPKCGRTKYTRGDATTIKTSSPACSQYAKVTP